MATLNPVIGQWFHRDNGTLFDVVAIDEQAGTVEIQQFDGTVDEIDLESWFEWPLVETSQPEDCTGSLDMDPEDFVGHRQKEMPVGFHDALDLLDRL